MRVEMVSAAGNDSWVLGLVGVHSERFRRVTLSEADLAAVTILDSEMAFDGEGALLHLGIQAYALGIAYEFDPYFGLSISRVDPLPHQLEAVYDYLLKLARVRFLLADDAGAGKTIMAGLLIRELKLRGMCERILIAAPANLAFQWQRELKEKFEEKFLVIKGDDIRDQFGVNQWLEQKQLITSLDLAKRTEILPGLRQVCWDLVIVDEAHRMSWTPPARKTARYALGELLRDSSDHILLLTATPHKGDPGNFSLFLQLLDPDAYADVRSIREAMERRRAPFYLRRTKEAMVYFPERQSDGSWVARKIFTKRIPHTVDFQIDGAEFDLYKAVTRFVKRQSARAAAAGDDPRARAVGFLMALYQRRLASSTRAVCCSLENRARRLEQGLKKAQEIARTAPPNLPDPEDLEEMDEGDRDRLEAMLEAVSLAGNAAEVQAEVAELKQLAEQGRAVERAGTEAKLSRLKHLLHEQGFFDQADKRLLLFTEFKDTLDYLVGKLTDWGFRVGCIHGGMRVGSRDDSGSRLHTEQQFREGAIQVLVATEAAGEGINLQVCNVLFNYDIPWNPNRLEQRMGRIHRYGQRKNCLIFNFVATNTIEGRVLQRLLEKLQEIRNALNDDAVFNVVGEVLPAAQIERVLREYYAGNLGEADLEDRMLQDVDENRFRAICQNALEGLASRQLNLEMLIERRARAQERRLIPETIARFLGETAGYASLSLKPVPSLPHTFDPGKTPTALKQYEHNPDWRLPALAVKYPRLSTDRETADGHNLEWVTPGHPLFEAVRRHTFTLAQEVFKKGACFHSLAHDEPARIDFYRARTVDGPGRVIHERLFAVEVREGREPVLRDPAMLGNLTPVVGRICNPSSAPEDGLKIRPTGEELPAVARLPEDSSWLHTHALKPFLDEVRRERLSEVERIAEHVELSLTELLHKADEEVGRAAAEVDKQTQGAEGRLKQAEDRHAELLARHDRRRKELQQQRSLTLQAVERLTSVLVLPHPHRLAPEVQRLRSNPETEATAMRVVMEYERSQGRQVCDVHEHNLGYDIISIDPSSGELRLIEVKGIGAAEGSVLLTPNEYRLAQDRRDCYYLYIVTHCDTNPTLFPPLKDPAQLPWGEVVKVQHYAMTLHDLRALPGGGA
jgi:superfamily II DNA or RNA helicase